MVMLTSFTVERAEARAIRRQLAMVQDLRREHVFDERERAVEAPAEGATEPEPLVQPPPVPTAG
ncbi:MAG: hypothetical protein ABIO70_29425 [Pseudomonadota bacterium]